MSTLPSSHSSWMVTYRNTKPRLMMSGLLLLPACVHARYLCFAAGITHGNTLTVLSLNRTDSMSHICTTLLPHVTVSLGIVVLDAVFVTITHAVDRALITPVSTPVPPCTSSRPCASECGPLSYSQVPARRLSLVPMAAVMAHVAERGQIVGRICPAPRMVLDVV